MMVKDGDKARVQTIQNCLSCPLCSNILNVATTITACLHTFCKECIIERLENDGTNCCPVCNVYLGCHPEDKLRHDNTLERMRTMIFQVKEAKSSKTPLTKRKEKSVSSLSITATPSVSGSKKGMARGTSRKASMSKETETNCPGKDVKGVTKNPNSSSSREGLNKFSTGSKKPVTLSVEDQSHDIITQSESHANSQCSLKNQGEGPEWEGLSVLAETADRAENLNVALSNVPSHKMVNNDNPPKKQTRRKKTAKELKSGQTSTIVNAESDNLPSKTTAPDGDNVLKMNDSNEQFVGASDASGSIAKMKSNDSPQIKQTRRLRKFARELKSGQSSTIMEVENDDKSSKITTNADGPLKVNDFNAQCSGAPNASASANNMENNDNHIKQTSSLGKSARELKSSLASTIVIIEDDDLPSKMTTPNADDALKISDSNEQRIGALKISDLNEQYIEASIANESSYKMENNDTPQMKQTGRPRKNARELKSAHTSAIMIVEDDVLPTKITTPTADDDLKITDSNQQYAGTLNASESSENSLRRLHPVWFVLLACEDPRRIPFPQIPKSYIKIKDGIISVAHLSKYVARKLGNTHESEVEILCCGQVAPPNATLLDLVKVWDGYAPIMDSPSEDVDDHVMVLSYRRK